MVGFQFHGKAKWDEGETDIGKGGAALVALGMGPAQKAVGGDVPRQDGPFSQENASQVDPEGPQCADRFGLVRGARNLRHQAAGGGCRRCHAPSQVEQVPQEVRS